MPHCWFCYTAACIPVQYHAAIESEFFSVIIIQKLEIIIFNSFPHKTTSKTSLKAKEIHISLFLVFHYNAKYYKFSVPEFAKMSRVIRDPFLF